MSAGAEKTPEEGVQGIPTPEVDKMLAVRDKSQEIGSFLEWLRGEKKIVLAAYEHDDLIEVYTSTNDLLAEYFEIDLNKVEAERRAILEGLRKAQVQPG